MKKGVIKKGLGAFFVDEKISLKEATFFILLYIQTDNTTPVSLKTLQLEFFNSRLEESFSAINSLNSLKNFITHFKL